MLFLTTVIDWEGIGRGSHVIDKRVGTEYVLDINNVSNLKPEGTGCRFWYLVNTTNRKTGYEEIHCTTPYLTVHEEFDVGPISSALELSVFPDNNIAKPPFTTYINIYDFSYAWAHNPYPQYSWLVYCPKGSREKRILVDMTLIELVGMDNQFDENNVQWWFYVDPLEEIFPNKFIRVE